MSYNYKIIKFWEMEAWENILFSLKTLSLFKLLTLWKLGFQGFLIFICENWEVYKMKYETTIIHLVNLYQYHSFQSEDLYEMMCPGITNIFYSLREKCEMLKLRDVYQYQLQHDSKLTKQAFLFIVKEETKLEINPEEKMTSILLEAYTRDMEANCKNKKNSSFKVQFQQKLVSLSDIIANGSQFYTGQSDWQNIFIKIYEKNKPNQELSGPPFSYCYRQLQPHSKNIPTYCPGCASFFCPRTNIRQDSLNKVPLIVLSKINNFHLKQSQLEKSMIALLNSGGGVILFDCQATYLSVFAIGCFISEESKQKITKDIKKVIEVIKCMTTNQKIDQCFKIAFVPMKNPSLKADSFERQQSILLQNQINKKQYMPGKYVTRITVCPLNSSIFYSSSKGQNDCQCFIMSKGEVKVIKNEQVQNIVKKKEENFQIQGEFLQDFKCLSFLPSNLFGHKCTDPNIGWPLNSVQLQSAPVKRIIIERSYRSMCLIEIQQKNLPMFKSKLRKRDVLFQIRSQFKEKRFSFSKSTVVLYHNLEHDHLLQTIFNKQNKLISKHKRFFISITQTLRLDRQELSTKQFKKMLDNLKGQMGEQFPREKLKIQQSQIGGEKKSQKISYLITQTKITALFLFYCLSSKGQKISFQEDKKMTNDNQQLSQGKSKLKNCQ